MQVVPTMYSSLNNDTIHSNQFSVTENFRESQAGAGRTLPGVFFFYDLSPIKVSQAKGGRQQGAHLLPAIAPPSTSTPSSRSHTHASPSPRSLQVKISETKSSFLHFVTNVCAIVGGVFTVSGIIDAFIYQSEKLIRKKLELGKLS